VVGGALSGNGSGLVARRQRWAFLGLGVAGVPLYAALPLLGDLRARSIAFGLIFAALALLHLAACSIVGRVAPRRALWVIGAFALVYRLLLVPMTPSLSDDFFRYVWDGFIQGQGYNPYRFPPEAPELRPLRDEYYWPRINRKEQTSAYPPFAELAFRGLALLAPFSATAFKLAFVALDLATVATLAGLLRLRGRPPTAAIWYAWHPLPIVEFAGSAHIDVLAVTLIAAALLLEARGRRAAAGVALGLATLTKLYPLLLLPAFTRRERPQAALAAIATVAIGFAPALLSGDTNFRQFPTYLREEGYRSGERYFPVALLRELGLGLPTALYVALAGVALAALAGWLVLGPLPASGLDVPRRATLLAGAAVLLVTPSYPWYFAWLIPLVALVPVAGLAWLTYTLPLLYVAWTLSVSAIQYLPAYALVARAALEGRGPIVAGRARPAPARVAREGRRGGPARETEER
jgi:alpha-1,6-mannosyltransferase